MFDFVRSLFDTAGFPARWSCGVWSDVHGWTHIIADLAIAGAYGAIPLSIAYFVSKRRDVQFPPLYWLFGAFILSCGLGHAIEASIFWTPWYRLSGLVKVITAIVSWATVLVVFRYLPKALDLPLIAELNERLRAEVRERTLAEEKVQRLNADLERKVQELQALFEVIPAGIGIARDPNCHDITVNQAFGRMLRVDGGRNVSLSSPQGRPSHFQVWKDGRVLSPEELPIQAAAARNVDLRDFEEEIVFSDGSRITLLASASPLRDESGAVRGAVGSFIDITARKAQDRHRLEVERRLLEAQRMQSLGILAGGIAHDFNNLLTSILGNAALVRMDPTLPVQHHDHVASIEDSAVRAADLCKQMLAYAGRARRELAHVDLSAVVHETVSLFGSSLSENTRLEVATNSTIPPVLADAAQFRQVVLNLVQNADEALGSNPGTISCSTRLVRLDREALARCVGPPEIEEGEFVGIRVTDSGAGMDAETQRQMFEPFFTTKFAGRGLGLAATLGIVRAHRGAIRVESDPGRGTTVEIFLPRASESTAPLDRGVVAAVDDSATRFGAGHEILIIDDEEAVRVVMAGMLERLGFRVEHTADGERAVEWIAADPSRFRLVVLDLTMPGYGGGAVFRDVRAVAANLDVLLVSGFSEDESIAPFAGWGLAGFVQKPFSFTVLRTKLAEILKARG